MSYNPPFTKEKSLFDTDMNIFSSAPPNEKTSLLSSLSTQLYHQEDSPSKNSSDDNLHADSTEETADTNDVAAAADDTASTATDTTMTAAANESIQEEEQGDDDEPEGPYENLLKQATLWTMEMRSLHDEIFMLQIRTAVKLDHLTMLGADEMMDFDYWSEKLR